MLDLCSNNWLYWWLFVAILVIIIGITEGIPPWHRYGGKKPWGSDVKRMGNTQSLEKGTEDGIGQDRFALEGDRPGCYNGKN